MNDDHADAFDGDPFGRFRREHSDVLAALDDLDRWALGIADAADPELPAAVAALERLVQAHTRAEDDVLYPALADSFPAGRGAFVPLRDDHEELRSMLGALVRWLALPQAPERDEQVQVVARDFIDLMRLHIHREEAAVFDVASRVLSEPEAVALARRMAPLLAPLPATGDAPGPSKGSRP